MVISSTIGPKSIKNILTLRYNPTKNSQIPKRNWQDFIEKPTGDTSYRVEELIISNIKFVVSGNVCDVLFTNEPLLYSSTIIPTVLLI